MLGRIHIGAHLDFERKAVWRINLLNTVSIGPGQTNSRMLASFSCHSQCLIETEGMKNENIISEFTFCLTSVQILIAKAIQKYT